MQYLFTRKELHGVSLGTVGTLTKMTWDQAQTAVQKLGLEKGVSNPRLVVEIEFKPGANEYGLPEYVYAAAEFEWPDFQRTVHLCKTDPLIHAVDGDKYTTGI
jgi:hypothetical protein